MKNYQMTAADLEAGMGDVYQATVQSGKPSRSWVWKAVAVIFLIALGSVASVLFVWHFMNHVQREHTSALQSTEALHSTPAPVHQQQMLPQTVNKTKAAIHLHVSGAVDGSLQWASGADQSFAMGGLKLENNEIVIPSNGLYFVYSQASFDVMCESIERDEESGTLLSYAIQWSSPAASSIPKYLLNGVKTVACQSSEEEGNDEHVYEIIYLGAVFKLYKGDKLSTDANHLAHIDKHSSKTFFGVFQL
ncbi:tumor necrosis factor b (TNF superfamily, member 2) [Salminus brasiliensis]|uniref:tumor necrosis factor b (TNF superfamily, member 2) n=1 Tax=Salminus brasiliensis TaxID=930266 RepID=UPI003B832747